MQPKPHPAGTVSRRHVFFIDGFDPKGPAHHHGLYTTQAARQTAVSGMPVNVGPRLNLNHHSSQWQIVAQEGGRRVETTYEYLRWDDIVRRHWPKTYPALLAVFARTDWAYLASGAWKRIAQALPASQWAAALPVATTAATLAACAAGGWAAAWMARPWGTAAALGSAFAAAAAVLAAGAAIERRVNTGWLTRIYAFTLRQARAEVPGLEERLNFFANRIAHAARQQSLDEVLVVGYSTGSNLAVSALARAIAQIPQDTGAQDPATVQAGPALHLLTLAQCTPLLSALPQASAFRQELARLANCPWAGWTDVSSVPDWGAFPGVDPYTFAGIEVGAVARPARLLSPRFHLLFKPPSWMRLRRDKRRIHQQYLMASELPGVYDYFAITAGGKQLDERLAP